MAAGWNKGKKWPKEVKQRISEGITKNHPLRVPNREAIIEKVKRWNHTGEYRSDCQCVHCSPETRLKIRITKSNKKKK